MLADILRFQLSYYEALIRPFYDIKLNLLLHLVVHRHGSHRQLQLRASTMWCDYWWPLNVSILHVNHVVQ